MVTKDRDTLKEGRIGAEDKPATIHIDLPDGDAWIIDATHHIISPETGVVSIYEGSRSAGVDVQTHVSRCVIDRRTSDADTCTAPDADETVNDGSDELKVMTDGGRRIDAPIVSRNPDRRGNGKSHWCKSRGTRVYAGRLECPYCDASDDDQDDDESDQELITDGGLTDGARDALINRRDNPAPEALAADWRDRWGDAPFDVFVNIDDGETVIDTSRDDDPTGRFTHVELPEYRGDQPAPVPKILFDDEDRSGTTVDPMLMHRCVETGEVFYAPDIRAACDCPVCGASTGTDDNESDQELITDGGRVLTSGDVVVHAGELWRVARMSGDHVEIYHGSAGPTVVPLSDIEAANGGER